MKIPRKFLIYFFLYRAKYLTFLDDDDVIKPNYLERLVKVAEFTGYDAISTFFDVFTAPPLTDPRAVTVNYFNIKR